jgi:DNA-binding NarL/FixJ family response regulator
MSIRVLIVDDHSVVRQGLSLFLGTDPDLEIVGQAANGAQAVSLARELEPDVVLMDLLMPVMDGIEATRLIRQELSGTEVIALTSVLEGSAVIGAVKAGAIGYLLKDTEAEELCRAIKAAAVGKVQLSPEAAALLIREVNATQQTDELTDREKDVLKLLCWGQTNKEIALHLSVAESTIKTHVSSILLKFGAQSRTQAAVIAAKLGLAELETS